MAFWRSPSPRPDPGGRFLRKHFEIGAQPVPKAVRDALGISEGDEVVFRVEGTRALLAPTPSLLSLAGTIPVPAAKRNVAWDEVMRRTRSDRAAIRR